VRARELQENAPRRGNRRAAFIISFTGGNMTALAVVMAQPRRYVVDDDAR
jgi:hypothetical protein